MHNVLRGNPDASILSAQYNNIYTTPGNVAKIRGAGEFSTAFPLSSNWPMANYNPDTSTYVKKVNGNVLPTYGSRWDLSEVAPVGKRINPKWTNGFSKTASTENFLGTPYQDFILKVSNETPTPLALAFFSPENVKYLSKRIVDDVRQLTHVNIKPQNEDSILVKMVHYYGLARGGSMPSTSVVHLALPRGEKACSLRDQLTRLNQAVLQSCIQDVLSGINMYLTYYRDASSLPVPLSHPVNPSSKGGRVLELNVGEYSGNSRGVQSFNLRNSVVN